MNNGDTFDLKSGTFKAPCRGNFQFTITDHGIDAENFSLIVEKNGSRIFSTYTVQYSRGQLSSTLILTLEINDEIRVQTGYHKTYSDSNCYRSFTGKLLQVL